jgi:hypothetical protein
MVQIRRRIVRRDFLLAVENEQRADDIGAIAEVWRYKFKHCHGFSVSSQTVDTDFVCKTGGVETPEIVRQQIQRNVEVISRGIAIIFDGKRRGRKQRVTRNFQFWHMDRFSCNGIRYCLDDEGRRAS